MISQSNQHEFHVDTHSIKTLKFLRNFPKKGYQSLIDFGMNISNIIAEIVELFPDASFVDKTTEVISASQLDDSSLRESGFERIEGIMLIITICVSLMVATLIITYWNRMFDVILSKSSDSEDEEEEQSDNSWLKSYQNTDAS